MSHSVSRAHSRRRLAAAGLGIGAAGLAGGAVPLPTAAAGAVINQLSYSSPNGDYIGQGENAAFNASNAGLTVSGTTASLNVDVSGSGHTWTLDLAAPTGTTLKPGYYGNAQRSAQGATPGVSLTGDGRGCNTDTGDFTVNAIGTDNTGNVNLIDASFSQSCGGTEPALHGEVRVGVPAAVALTGPASPLSAGTVAVLTATVASNATGTVTFLDGQTSLGSATLGSGGSAAIGVALAAGTHVLTAHYNGDRHHVAATSGFLLEQVTGSTTTTSYQYTSTPGDYIGQGASNSYSPPSASFGHYGSLGSLTTTVSSATDSWTIVLAAPLGSQLAVGTYDNAVRAGFQSGNAPGLDVYGEARGCNTVYGTFTISAIDSDALGDVDFLDATYTQHCEGPTAAPLTGTIRYGAPPEGTTTVALSSSATSVAQGTAVTFTAAVGSAGAAAGGSIVFSDGATTLGTAPLNSSGVATLTTTSLAVGTDNVTASYPGNASIEPATSSPVSVSVQRTKH